MGVGLLLALYNANTTTDWVRVAHAAARIPIRAIVPVDGVSPPDPDWAPDFPTADAFRKGVQMLRNAGVETAAYAHLRNISRQCCTCCGNLTQFSSWVDLVQATGIDTMMLDNLDAPWSSTQPYHPDGLHEMYVPAVEELRRRKMGVWANGPHVLSDGSVENASLWSEYLGLASFTTLFEISYDNWLHGASTNYEAALHWPKEKLGGYVLDLPDSTTAAAPLIDASLRAARDRGLTWLYPTVKCKHGTGPHQGSCTYADLPSYFDALVDAVERLGAED